MLAITSQIQLVGEQYTIEPWLFSAVACECGERTIASEVLTANLLCSFVRADFGKKVPFILEGKIGYAHKRKIANKNFLWLKGY